MLLRCALLLIATLPMAAEAAERVLDLQPRPDAVLRVLTDSPADAPPKGSVVLLAGGSGKLDIDPQGKIGGLAGNQLIRSRGGYLAAGYAYFAPDIASDLKPQQNYRYKPEFGRDIGLVIAEARKLGVPVHLIGTSRGAISVAALFNSDSPERPDSAVITSGMLITYKIPAADSLGPRWVQVPVLLLRHQLDACPVTPPSDADRYAKLLSKAPKVDIVTLNGGAQPKSEPCEAAHYHGFWGMDDAVVNAITAWIAALK